MYDHLCVYHISRWARFVLPVSLLFLVLPLLVYVAILLVINRQIAIVSSMYVHTLLFWMANVLVISNKVNKSICTIRELSSLSKSKRKELVCSTVDQTTIQFSQHMCTLCQCVLCMHKRNFGIKLFANIYRKKNRLTRTHTC